MAERGMKRAADGRRRDRREHLRATGGSAAPTRRDDAGVEPVEQLALGVEASDGQVRAGPRPKSGSRRNGRDTDAAADAGGEADATGQSSGRDLHSEPLAAPPAGGAGAVQPSLVLTVPQVEAALQLGRTRTYELIRSGEIPVLRVGRLIRVSRAVLERWVAEHSLGRSGDGPGLT